MKAGGLARATVFAAPCRIPPARTCLDASAAMSSSPDTGANDLEAERDYWRTLVEVTNAVVTKRDLAALRTAIAPNVRRLVPHDHTNLYLFDEDGRLGPFVVDPSAPAWPDDLANLVRPEAEPYRS